jgi:hypothetical protein
MRGGLIYALMISILMSFQMAYVALPFEYEIQEVFSHPEQYELARQAQGFPRNKLSSCEKVPRRYNQDELKLTGLARWIHNSGNFPQYGQFVKMEKTTEDYKIASRYHYFAAPITRDFILDISRIVKEQISKHPLYITAATSDPTRFTFDNHCLHRSGYSLDIRPLPGTQPTQPGFKNYNREMNRAFILELVNDMRVKRIYFNDYVLLKDSEIRAAILSRRNTNYPVEFVDMKHHFNHIHLELYWEDQLQQLSTEVLKVFRGKSDIVAPVRQPVGKAVPMKLTIPHKIKPRKI